MTPRRTALCLTLVCLVSLAVAGPVQAAWPHTTTANLRLTSDTRLQFLPQTVSDDHGGAFIAWTDAPFAGVASTHVQHVDSLGAPRWTPGGVGLTNQAAYDKRTVLVPDGAGGVIVGWLDIGADPASPRLYLQRLDAFGVSQWSGGGPADGVAVSGAGGWHGGPSIVADGAGGAIVFWYDTRISTVEIDVYAQRVSAAGSVLWNPNGVAVCSAPKQQYSPVAARDGGGGAIVAWYDARAGFGPDIYAQRIDALGVPAWTANGVVLCDEAGTQFEQAIASDGQGGAIVSWTDQRPTGTVSDVYAQRLNGGGNVLWTTDGVAVCSAVDVQQRSRVISDGSGGAIVVWPDDRTGAGANTNIYARRVSAAGTPLGSANGTGICTSAGTQSEPEIASDGARGAIITWMDGRFTNDFNVFAQRFDSTGAVRWAPNGVAATVAPSQQMNPTIAADDQGGAILAWMDYRNETCPGEGCQRNDVYAQRIERLGYLGNPEPLASIVDVPEDQGGAVNLVWAASYLDSLPEPSIGDYQVFRSQGADPAWTQVATVPATQALAYSVAQSSIGIASPSSTPRVRFRVVARSSGDPSNLFFPSRIDSGTSIDNLPPPSPTPLAGAYAAGTTDLDWDAVSATDVLEYRVYRDANPSFVPGPSNFVASVPGTAYADPAGSPFIYRVTAVDTHGNEGPYGTWAPAGTVDVPPGATPLVFAFAPPMPNPARGAVSFDIVLPHAARAQLTIYDIVGRRVALVHDGPLDAGPHVFGFALRDDAGRALPSGVFVARLTVDGKSISRRWAVLRSL
jgi:hypothetical protein